MNRRRRTRQSHPARCPHPPFRHTLSRARIISTAEATMPVVRYRLVLAALLLSAGTLGAQPRLDPFGDPLPAGARFRIGSTRLQLDREIQAVAASADGRRVAAVSDSMLGVWEVPGRRELVRLPA